MKHCVYIIECNDGSFYTGYTLNIEKRLWQHNFGKRGAKSIKGKLPVKLVHLEKYNTKSKALRRELEIKSWPRLKKIELINNTTAPDLSE